MGLDCIPAGSGSSFCFTKSGVSRPSINLLISISYGSFTLEPLMQEVRWSRFSKICCNLMCSSRHCASSSYSLSSSPIMLSSILSDSDISAARCSSTLFAWTFSRLIWAARADGCTALHLYSSSPQCDTTLRSLSSSRLKESSRSVSSPMGSSSRSLSECSLGNYY